MRVIGGQYRSQRLIAPSGMKTRPTSDRLRETLFNVIAPRIEGAVFADLYAGSGAVGIEALSRGAANVCFVERDPAAVAIIRRNLSALKINSGFRIFPSKVAAALTRIEAADIVFLDPPYIAEDEYAQTLGYLGRADRYGLVVAEHDRKIELAEEYGKLHRFRVLQQGDATLSFFTQSQPPST
jgi:16S rRNA (guanine966-N2)-methyltransferase